MNEQFAESIFYKSYMHWCQIQCFNNNLHCVIKMVGFVYASMGLNIEGMLVHVTILDSISAIGALLPCKTLVASMSVVLAYKIIL